MSAKTEKKIKANKNGGARPGSGRKAFRPTPEEREMVKNLSGYGVPIRQIAAMVRDGISEATIYKIFSNELERGKAVVNSKVARRLLLNALEGDTTAAIWWTKSRMKWSEKHELDLTNSDGSFNLTAAVSTALKEFNDGLQTRNGE